MSLPPELRFLCAQLSSTPPTDLPRLTPSLLRNVLRCRAPLSSAAGNAAKTDTSASSVLVHKLKTQLTTLLNGKTQEGRLVAVILIKAVVEVGGWEVLRGAESWVRGLLALLGKPDNAASKELCIIALTKIYCMTHQYPTLIREITTPTLPTFVTSCLNLISNTSSKVVDVPSSLVETVFQSFTMLLPRHTTIYRPFTSQIRLAIKPFIAPTLEDGLIVTSSLKGSARDLVVILHQTVPKGAGGEEWSKAVRGLVKDIHVTADNVFRAVMEDWESTAGYVGEPVNVNQEISGGGANADDLPPWTGVAAGVERLTGLLEMLAEYFRSETSTPVSIPLGAIMDVVVRMLSIALSSSDSSSRQGSARLHPAIDRDERDGLWCGMPQIYVAALELVNAVAERMQEGFMPIAQGIFDQLVWVYPFGKSTPEFRLVTYVIVAKILLHIGQSFDRTQAGKLGSIIRSCCKDLQSLDPSCRGDGVEEDTGKQSRHNANQNADTFLQNKQNAIEVRLDETNLVVAARKLLSLLLSHIPQEFLDISLRSSIERTAILSHDKDAMLSSILNPFVGKNGKALASVLPHLTQAFGSDQIVEILLRPRMPLLPSAGARLPTNDAIHEESEDEDMGLQTKLNPIQGNLNEHNTLIDEHAVSEYPGLGPAVHTSSHDAAPGPINFDLPSYNPVAAHNSTTMDETMLEPNLNHPRQPIGMEDTRMEDESSDEESAHLNMSLDGMDSDSE
ncbi:Pre-rRNA-processing protein [Lachnellula hyalina]|uniref:Pre-rRNA-processing protein RIX1 n=1 Tax=Lachnellula hyalina TaxID=1316788 RepID=A0A8H8U0V6_9HELO|nr:Pre-rRNA-processing protein [Lachnellula hyalina]TVY26396.1 Pre-rRNA-processing protein [Lachnellula hyalina]